jgi:hypothetical protein
VSTEVVLTPASRVYSESTRILDVLAKANAAALKKGPLDEVRANRTTVRLYMLAAYLQVLRLEDDVNELADVDSKVEFIRLKDLISTLRFQRVGPPSPKPPKKRQFGEPATLLIHPTLAVVEIGNAMRSARMLRLLASQL